jgi:tricorn protease
MNGSREEEMRAKLKLEVAAKKKEEDNKKKESDDQKKEKVPDIVIDLDGIVDRITEVPLPAGRYRVLSMNDKNLFWTESDPSSGFKTKLVTLEIKNKDISPKTLVEDVSGYDLSRDGKKLMVQKGTDIYLIEDRIGMLSTSDSAPFRAG